jgi:hypothetical protein
MQDVIHHAGLARWRDHAFALIEEVVAPYQRSVRIIDLVGLGIEQIQCVELDAPAVVEAVAKAGIEDAGRRRLCYSACNFDPLSRGIGVQN